MNTYRALMTLAIVFATGCSMSADTEDATNESDQVLAAGTPTGECTTDADCGGKTCVTKGMPLAPIGYCFDDKYVWCTTWSTTAATEATNPDSNWKCEAGEIFALCLPTPSDVIDASCKLVRPYDPDKDVFMGKCCKSSFFDE